MVKVITFSEYYRMLKFLFGVEWICFRDEMGLDDRQDFLMELDLSIGQFQDWMN